MSVWVGEGVIGSRCEGEAMAAACQSIDVDETWHLGGCECVDRKSPATFWRNYIML